MLFLQRCCALHSDWHCANKHCIVWQNNMIILRHYYRFIVMWKTTATITYLRHSGDADTVRYIFKLSSLRIVCLQQQTTATFQVCNKPLVLWRYWLGDRASAPKPLCWQLISECGIIWSTLLATSPAYFKKEDEEFWPVCKDAIGRIIYPQCTASQTDRQTDRQITASCQ